MKQVCEKYRVPRRSAGPESDFPIRPLRHHDQQLTKDCSMYEGCDSRIRVMHDHKLGNKLSVVQHV